MRPAPQTQPTPDGDAPESTDLEAPARPGEARPLTRHQKAQRRSRHRLLIGLFVVAVAVAGAGIGVWAVVTNPASGPGTAGTPATTPARPRFFFRIADVTADSTGRAASNVAQDASVEIAGQLSYFYDTVFMDPATWKDGVPDSAWLIFDPSVRERARQDGASFTLGSEGADLKSLRVSNSSFSVEVLIDPHGNPKAAVANVEFEAAGSLTNGDRAIVKNKASFLLQLQGVEWVVFGYPTASTTFETRSLTPSPGQSSGPGASLSPTSTGGTP
jgi:hypothetical protein